MHCPFCNTPDCKVIDSRLAAEGRQIRRRRECLACSERFTTFEIIELVMPRVIKSNGQMQPFDEGKLRRSITLPLQKRPVSLDQIDTAIAKISQTLRSLGERELPARRIGEEVMNALRELDSVAYVRFASVYRDFKDVAAFRDAVDQLDEGETSHD
jgi:transcriptional repressor NrdR